MWCRIVDVGVFAWVGVYGRVGGGWGVGVIVSQSTLTHTHTYHCISPSLFPPHIHTLQVPRTPSPTHSKTYEADWDSKSSDRRQMAVALYFIDKLALRAGHEKDEDEADTVGCCTLKCENVEALDGNTIRFDFLGKDSIRYENEVEVDPRVYKAIKEFKARFPDGTGM